MNIISTATSTVPAVLPDRLKLQLRLYQLVLKHNLEIEFHLFVWFLYQFAKGYKALDISDKVDLKQLFQIEVNFSRLL